MNSPADRHPISLTAAILSTRLAVLLAGVIGVVTIGTVPPQNYPATWRIASNELANLLARWDTFWYHSIATRGYHWDPTQFRHENVVFFPLYPMLMRWGGWLIGGHPLVAGFVVSAGAFAGAMWVLYRLARLDLGEQDARAALVLLAAYPFALYYSVVYSEALFLFVIATAFYAMRRGLLMAAALFGLAAGLTRPNGLWLSVPLFLLAIRDGESSGFRGRRIAALAVCLAPIAGTAIYSGYLYFRFGDGLAWVHGQAAWGLPLFGGHGAVEPGDTFPDHITVTDVLTWTGNIASFALALVAVRPVFRRFGAAYAALIVFTVIPPLATHLFMSMGRFTSVLFPVFLWLGAVVPRERLPRVAWSFAAAQMVLAFLFFLWRPVV